MSDIDASSLGPRGLIIHSTDGKYYYLLEPEWRKCGVLASTVKLSETLARHEAIAGKTIEGFFVNFEKLQIGDKPDPIGQDAMGAAGNDSIVIHERVNGEEQFYAIPATTWRQHVLDEGADSDAGVLVRRGAVVAAIPDVNVPVGTFCALINFAVLK
jgi:hypothetical protein